MKQTEDLQISGSSGSITLSMERLQPKLSSKASIASDSSVAPRWTEYLAPQPTVVVNVAEEKDVAETVKYCIENNWQFLAQSGGHNWATTLSKTKTDVLINLRGLNNITFNEAKDEVTFGGGTIVEELVEASYQNERQVATGICNSVGVMGATFGGGLGRLLGSHGLAIDTLLSVNLVTATGDSIKVTPESSPDLWWALRGAGSNFGIATSATMKAYPMMNSGMAWTGNLIFTEDKLDAVIQAANDLELKDNTSFALFFAAPPPAFAPVVVFELCYYGSEAEGKAAFKTLYDIGPVADMTGDRPLNRLNDSAAPFCAGGDRKVGASVGVAVMDPKAFRETWNAYIHFLQENPSAGRSALLVEGYSTGAMRRISTESSAFPHRNVNFNVVIITWYTDPALDEKAEAFVKMTRKFLTDTSGLKMTQTYIGFAGGDEDLKTVYGGSLERLRKVKKQWDPDNRFNKLFPIT